MTRKFRQEKEVNSGRVRLLKQGAEEVGPVIYWMVREKRVQDNWAIIFAQALSKKHVQPLGVVFCYGQYLPEQSLRQLDFMLEGLKEVEKGLKKLKIPFILLSGDPTKVVPAFCKKHKVGTLVTDFFPLRSVSKAQKIVGQKVSIPLYQVDAHNIVPCWQASQKQEYAARTIRPKIKKKLNEYLTEFPKVVQQKTMPDFGQGVIHDSRLKNSSLKKNHKDVQPIIWLKPGMSNAKKVLTAFLRSKIKHYATRRNDPNADVLSNLSPYFHFGFIAPQRVALQVYAKVGATKSRESFLEEMIIRRELSDNFCFYNKSYDSLKGCADWAQKTLKEHATDKREYVYTKTQLEHAQTHDDLWNAAQKEMVLTGKMHGYLRMYWAKKILEWTKTPEYAIKVALELNDMYELDGCDPNGYVGVLWSIGGLHDRAWFKRPIFGSIRYMSYNGARSKFDVDAYVKKIEKLSK